MKNKIHYYYVSSSVRVFLILTATATLIKATMPVTEILEARWSARLMANQFYMEPFHGELGPVATKTTRMFMQRFLISQTGFLISLSNGSHVLLSTFQYYNFNKVLSK